LKKTKALAPVAILGFALLAAPARAQQPQPSPSETPATPSPLGAAGKPSPGKAKSYTDDDLDRLAGRKPGDRNKPTGTATTASSGPRPQDTAPQRANENGGDEPLKDTPLQRANENASAEGDAVASQGWAERAQAAQAAADEAQRHAADLEAEAQALLWQTIQSSDSLEILRLKSEQQAVIDQIPAAKQAAEVAQKALADFEEQARLAGVPRSELQPKTKP
jgi:hypothetical protein